MGIGKLALQAMQAKESRAALAVSKLPSQQMDLPKAQVLVSEKTINRLLLGCFKHDSLDFCSQQALELMLFLSNILAFRHVGSKLLVCIALLSQPEQSSHVKPHELYRAHRKACSEFLCMQGSSLASLPSSLAQIRKARPIPLPLSLLLLQHLEDSACLRVV